MAKRKFSGKRLIKLIRGILTAWFLILFAFSFFLACSHLLSGCPHKFYQYDKDKVHFQNTVIAFCKKYDFKGKWGQSDRDWEGKYHFKGDYKLEDCITAYEKQETLEAVSYYGDPPEGIVEKIWNPPNFRGMMRVRIVGEERKVPLNPALPEGCYRNTLSIASIIFMIGLFPVTLFYVVKFVFNYIFPERTSL